MCTFYQRYCLHGSVKGGGSVVKNILRTLGYAPYTGPALISGMVGSVVEQTVSLVEGQMYRKTEIGFCSHLKLYVS